MKPAEITIDAPLRGEWAAIQPPGHHPYAFDFIATGGSKKRFLKSRFLKWILFRISIDDFYGWAQPIYSPIDGTVMDARDGIPDRNPINLIEDILTLLVPIMFNVYVRKKFVRDYRPYIGNYVIIQSQNIFSLLAHLRCGSVRAPAGQQVRKGELLGEVGNSGTSLGPHLHFQMMIGDKIETSEIIPFSLHKYERRNRNEWEYIENKQLIKGDRIKI